MSRHNFYSEEWADDVEVGVVEQASREGKLFCGLRVWLATPEALLKHMAESGGKDDDRSAATFWAASLEELEHLVREMQLAVETAKREYLR